MSTKARRKNNELNFQKWRYWADMRETFLFLKPNREERARRLYQALKKTVKSPALDDFGLAKYFSEEV